MLKSPRKSSHHESSRRPSQTDAATIHQILSLLGQVTDRFENEGNEEWQWIAAHASNPQIVTILRDSTPAALRVINAIGQREPVNGITISKEYRIPKGSVSKITRRLLAQKLITQESLLNNHKEILFRLTPLGKELFEVHRTFDKKMEQGFIRFLSQYTPAELCFMQRFLQDVLVGSFLNFKPRSGAKR